MRDECSRWVTRLRLSVWYRFWLGLGAGLVGLCVAIEIVRAIYRHGWTHAFFAVVEYTGQFKWLTEFQTLFTGVAAVAAAVLSVRAVRDQITSSEKAVQRQIDHSTLIEEARLDAKRDAARTSLPLTLSSICDYAQASALALRALRQHTQNRRPADVANPPVFPPVPEQAVQGIKEMVEHLPKADRMLFSSMVGEIQVHSARVRDLGRPISRRRRLHQSDYEIYVGNCALIYAQASSLFDFARGEATTAPHQVDAEFIESAFAEFGIYSSELRASMTDRVRRRAGLPPSDGGQHEEED
jgi:hypothetical protein